MRLSFMLAFLVWTLTSILSAASMDKAQVQIDEQGNSVAIWQDKVNGINQIFTATYSASDGTWSATKQLSDPTQDSSGPLLSMNSAGNAVALWISSYGERILMAARYTIGGSWSSASSLSPAGQTVTDNYQVKVNDAGASIAIWTALVGAESWLAYSTVSTLTGSWSSATPVSNALAARRTPKQEKFPKRMFSLSGGGVDAGGFVKEN